MKLQISICTKIIFFFSLFLISTSIINFFIIHLNTISIDRKLFWFIIQQSFIIFSGIMIIFFNKIVVNMVSKEEQEKAQVVTELSIANSLLQKEKMIIEQKEQIEAQNKEILQQKQLVDKLYRDAVQSNISKTEFFSNIAHELKTPISVILSTVQLMNMQIDKNYTEVLEKAKYAKYLRIVKQNSYRLIKLINTLLQLTKIDSGFIEINLENADIVKTIRDICFSVSEYIKQKGINFEFSSSLNKKVIAFDLDKIEKILLNLISNAAKFTPAGGSIKVDLSFTQEYVILSVKDTGVGIPKEKLNTIFDRFKQARTSQTWHHEGCGIGLSLVKSLVELHNGYIEVYSEINKGTEFKVFIQSKTIADSCSESKMQNTYNYNDRLYETINAEFAEFNPLN